MIEEWILPHLTIGTRGFETTVPLTEIVECIFYRLKTGCQWRELPTKAFFTTKVLGSCLKGVDTFLIVAANKQFGH